MFLFNSKFACMYVEQEICHVKPPSPVFWLEEIRYTYAGILLLWTCWLATTNVSRWWKHYVRTITTLLICPWRLCATDCVIDTFLAVLNMFYANASPWQRDAAFDSYHISYKIVHYSNRINSWNEIVLV